MLAPAFALVAARRTGSEQRPLVPANGTAASSTVPSPPGVCKEWTGMPEEEARPLRCGALVYLHIGKTGGSTLTEYMLQHAGRRDGRREANHSEANRTAQVLQLPVEKASAAFLAATAEAGFNSYELFSDSSNVDVEFSKWQTLKDLEYNIYHRLDGKLPKIAVQLHHGVPGIGAALWDSHLQPWKAHLESEGCELRLVTVLRARRGKHGEEAAPASRGTACVREPKARLISSYDYAREQYAEARGIGFCEHARRCSNVQTKYLLAGGDSSRWPEHLQRLDAAEDAKLLPSAAAVLAKMAFVGRTEELDLFVRHLNRVLGLPSELRATPTNPTGNEWKKDWTRATAAEWQCLEAATAADAQLYTAYCRPP